MKAGALERLQALGFSDDDSCVPREHFLEAERRGRQSHGLSRIAWLDTLSAFDPAARPARVAHGRAPTRSPPSASSRRADTSRATADVSCGS